jgi:hemerythrin superfamily protein
VTIDSNFARRGEFPADRPLDALRTEHRLVRQLFEQYFQARDETDKRDTGTHILLLLDMHTSLEEGVFYPRVQEIDPTLIVHCEHEHEQARRIIEMLKPMDEGDPQAERLFRQLADAVFAHIDNEEQQLFPKVEQAGLDLHAIGNEMMALETRMIAAHAQRPVAPGLRQ